MRANSVTPSPAIGSSSSRSCGRVASATASSSSRCSPWLRRETSDIGAMSEPDPLQRCLRGLAQVGHLARIAPEVERVTVMRLRRQRDIVRCGEIRQQRGDLKRARQPQRAAAIGRHPGDVPAARVGCCRNSAASCPVSWLISVVLPAPFGPMIACNSPFATSSETWSVAMMPPNRGPVSRRGARVQPRRSLPSKPVDAAAPEQHDQ